MRWILWNYEQESHKGLGIPSFIFWKKASLPRFTKEEGSVSEIRYMRLYRIFASHCPIVYMFPSKILRIMHIYGDAESKGDRTNGISRFSYFILALLNSLKRNYEWRVLLIFTSVWLKTMFEYFRNEKYYIEYILN